MAATGSFPDCEGGLDYVFTNVDGITIMDAVKNLTHIGGSVLFVEKAEGGCSEVLARKLKDSYDKKSDEYKQLNAALSAYGKEGDHNGVTVGFKSLDAEGHFLALRDLVGADAQFDEWTRYRDRIQHGLIHHLATGAAVATLLRIMTDREAPASSRIRAADIILQGAFRGMELEDIEARIAELERAAETAKNR